MNINDTLLHDIIQRDLQNQAIKKYVLEDKVTDTPTTIKVGVNETVYITYLRVHTAAPFQLQIKSATQVVNYDEKTTALKDNGSTLQYYESQHITSHKGNIHIKNTGSVNFLLRYIIVKHQTKKA